MAIDPRISLSILENVPQVIILIKPDDFEVVYINRVAGKYTFDSLIGKPITSFILAEFKEQYTAVFHDVVSRKKEGSIDLKSPTSINPNGLTWYKTHLIPLLDNEGNVEYVLSVSEHIEAQKNAEQEVIIKQKNLEAIINNTDDIIVSIDKSHRLIEFNEVFRNLVKIGYGLDVSKGEDVLTYIYPGKHESYKSIYKRVLAGEKVIDVEKFAGSKGDIFYYEASFNPLYNHRNEIYGITIFTRNITKRIEHDNILKQALAEKEILLSEIHHRIKNNLAVISSMLQIQSHCNKSPEISQALEETKLRIKSAAIVHELLYEQKLFSNISVKQFLAVLLQEIKSTYGTELVEVEVTGDDFKVDLQQAVPFALLMNEIYTNTFKHGFPDSTGGYIHTIVAAKGAQCDIRIIEDGLPFPDDIGSADTASVGMILIEAFIGQLNGKIEFKKAKPKEIHLVFAPE